MSNANEFQSLVNAARAELDDPARNGVVGDAGDTPRFEVFHAGLSICSQKVRAVLAEKESPYLSHEMVIVASKGLFSEDFRPAENYRPGYVRLRMSGGEQLTTGYATEHTGVSSVETEGFDPCVVPLLLDHKETQVIVDSMRICEYLDKAVAGPRTLIPAGNVEVRKQAKVVDRFPHPGLLYGFHPDDDRRPDFVKGVMKDVHDVKCSSLQKFIDENSDDAALVAAYRSKIAKEQAGKALAFDPERQRGVRNIVQTLIDNLDVQLREAADPWVCGSEFSFADIVWAISLYRMHWLGLASLWADKPGVKEYARRVYKRPSIWEQVINYPSPMLPSPHTADIE